MVVESQWERAREWVEGKEQGRRMIEECFVEREREREVVHEGRRGLLSLWWARRGPMMNCFEERT